MPSRLSTPETANSGAPELAPHINVASAPHLSARGKANVCGRRTGGQEACAAVSVGGVSNLSWRWNVGVSQWLGAPMGRPLALSLGLAAALAFPLWAQQEISIPALFTAEITQSDPQVQGRHYKLFKFTGTAGQTIEIQFSCDVFSAYIEVFETNNQQILPDESNGRRVYHLSYTGQYQLVVVTAEPGQFGFFLLQVRNSDSHQMTDQPSTPSAESWPVMARVSRGQGDVRRTPAWADPRYWAAFQLVGAR